MAAESKRLTFVATQEITLLLADAKKKYFYDKTQSDMIRELIMAGLDTVEKRSVGELPGNNDTHRPQKENHASERYF